eukprot:m.124848 g.124848  ORF g.124848 m.124848 type:complete len:543 (-) comp9427_c0_seq1:773-2401(-)
MSKNERSESDVDEDKVLEKELMEGDSGDYHDDDKIDIELGLDDDENLDEENVEEGYLEEEKSEKSEKREDESVAKMKEKVPPTSSKVTKPKAMPATASVGIPTLESVQNSKRRAPQQSEDENPSKKTNSGNNEEKMLKLLVSKKLCGSVIGRGGSTIKELQRDGVMIRVSQNHECYPETNDRVIVLKGPSSLLPQTTVNVMNRAYESNGISKDTNTIGSTPAHMLATQMPSNGVAVLVIPTSSAGLVLGHGGEKIRSMQAQFDCQMKLSRLNEVSAQFHERVLTITNNAPVPPLEACKHVVELLIDNPDVFEYDHTQGTYPVPSMPPMQEMYAAPLPPLQGMPQFGGPSFGRGEYGGSDQRQDTYHPPGQQGYSPSMTQQRVQSGPYGSQSHGNMPYGHQQSNFFNPDHQRQQSFYQDQYGRQSSRAQPNATPSNGRSYFDSPREPSYTATPIRSSDGSVAYQLYVADSSVGLIVGRGGDFIRTIIQTSGAQVKISQKGEYKEGTHDRIVTISGSTSSIEYAIDMIHKKLNSSPHSQSRSHF